MPAIGAGLFAANGIRCRHAGHRLAPASRRRSEEDAVAKGQQKSNREKKKPKQDKKKIATPTASPMAALDRGGKSGKGGGQKKK